MDKEEGRRILKRLQACVSYRNDEDAADVLAMVRDVAAEELAKLAPPAAAEERSERGGQDRQRKGGRDRVLI